MVMPVLRIGRDCGSGGRAFKLCNMRLLACWFIACSLPRLTRQDKVYWECQIERIVVQERQRRNDWLCFCMNEGAQGKKKHKKMWPEHFNSCKVNFA